VCCISTKVLFLFLFFNKVNYISSNSNINYNNKQQQQNYIQFFVNFKKLLGFQYQ